MTMWKFANNASGTLAIALAIDAVTVQLAVGDGTMFPSLSQVPPRERLSATVTASDGQFEIVLVTQVVGDTLTVVRAQEGTPARTFAVGSRVELRLTTAVMNDLLQTGGGNTQDRATYDYHNSTIRNVHFPTPADMDHVRARSIRPLDKSVAATDMIGVIEFPLGGFRTRLNGSQLLVAKMLEHVIWAWSGNIADLEAFFKLCDGTQGTPDLRSRFLIGGSPGVYVEPDNPFPYGRVGGSFHADTEGAGAHSHGGVTGNVALTGAQLPALAAVSNSRQDASGPTQSITSIGYSTTPGGVHAHTIPGVADHAHAVIMRQPFYAVAFVMFHLPGFAALPS